MICSLCQNYEISQYVSKSEYIDIAFTCNEPFTWYDYKAKDINKVIFYH